MNDEEYIAQSVRRRVGREVLRRLRRVAEEDSRQQALDQAWARRLAWALALVGLCALAWLALR